MVNFLSHRARETRSVSQFVVLLSVADQVPFLQIGFLFWADVARQALLLFFLSGVEVINGWPVVSIFISAETSVTLL